MGHHEVVWRLLEKGAHVGERGSSQQASLALSAVRHSNVEPDSLGWSGLRADGEMAVGDGELKTQISVMGS